STICERGGFLLRGAVHRASKCLLRPGSCHSFRFLSFWFCFVGGFPPGAFFAEQSEKAGGCALAQAIEDSRSRLIEGSFVLKDVVVPVCGVAQGVKLEGKLGGIDSAVELSEALGVTGFVLDGIEP